jgi:predicted transglutaminase-like cysteine proteinase
MIYCSKSLYRVSLVVLAATAPTFLFAGQKCSTLELPIAYIDGPPEKYVEFCYNNEGACELSGEQVVDWSEDVQSKLKQVNVSVNEEVAFVPDWEAEGLEDVWAYPRNCSGDCEDIALEKRRLLVADGFPSAALTMAIAFHKVQFFPHAVLLVETTTGTRVMDNIYEDVLCWDAVPCIYTNRERPDGQWTRFKLP